MRLLFAVLALSVAWAQESDPKLRRKGVESIIEAGGARSLEALTPYLADVDPAVQQTAIEGLVNFYLPGYFKAGWKGRWQRAASRLTNEDEPIVPAYVEAKPEIVAAIGKTVRESKSMEVKAAGCRALGVLRAAAETGTLLDALATKNTPVLYEVLTAIEKIRHPAVAPKLFYMLRDPDEKVQIAAIQTVSVLGNRDANGPLREAWERTKSLRVRRALIEAMAMLPAQENRTLFEQHLDHKDDMLRAGAAEGLGRLLSKEDLPRLKALWDSETKIRPRLSLAFANVRLGDTEAAELSPLQYLINTLNHNAWKGVAETFLKDLAGDASVRFAVHSAALQATREEKIAISAILAHTGARDSIETLETLGKDADPEVATAALRALRILRARA
jgi:HEAT repeat protein